MHVITFPVLSVVFDTQKVLDKCLVTQGPLSDSLLRDGAGLAFPSELTKNHSHFSLESENRL